MKRKDPPEAASTGDNKRARPSTPVDDELEDEGNPPLTVKQTKYSLVYTFTLSLFFKLFLLACQPLICLLVPFCQTGIETQLSSRQTIPKWTPTVHQQSDGTRGHLNWTVRERRRLTPQGRRRSHCPTGRRRRMKWMSPIGCCQAK